MVSIPRDYYVETACDAADGCGRGQMDKLTHTGLHGAHTTQATLEKLFGIEINYTLRVNFSSVQTIVDALGGIEVDNPQTFSIGGYTFEPGRIHLDGDQALMFSRERKSFGEGDRERGRNQMRVFSGTLDKVTTPPPLPTHTTPPHDGRRFFRDQYEQRRDEVAGADAAERQSFLAHPADERGWRQWK